MPSRRVETLSALQAPHAPVRRIRHDVRDGAYVMVFSCLASSVTAVALVLLLRLAG